MKKYIEPQAARDLRVESGVEAGDQITPFYDPMIAKVISFGGSRKAAIEKLSDALDTYFIDGLETNISFLQELLGRSDFKTGKVSTTMIDEAYPNGFDANITPDHSLFETFVNIVANE